MVEGGLLQHCGAVAADVASETSQFWVSDELITITRNAAVKTFQSAGEWRQASRLVSDVADRALQLNTTRCNAAMSACENIVDWRRVPSWCRGGHQGAGSGDSSCMGSVCSKSGSRWYEALLLLNCVISGCHC